MRELFRKYLDNNCSPAEVRKLLSYFKIDENEVILRRLITDWLEKNAEEEDEDYQWQNNFYSDLRLFQKQLSIQVLKLIAIIRKIEFQFAIAPSPIQPLVAFTFNTISLYKSAKRFFH